MAFREQQAWATLAATLLAYGGFLLLQGPHAFSIDAGSLRPSAAFLWFLAAYAGLFFGISQAVFFAGPKEKPQVEDERERAIAHVAGVAALWVLEGAVATILFVPSLNRSSHAMADALVATLILAQAAGAARTVWAYRRGGV